ncbi:MAG TPA: ABC transporter permease [Vicinamibacterales bacterium]|nr:ABC transporter permease [Vicinamibacterales bacterium]
MTDRLYRLILRLAPRGLREAHGDEMREMFVEHLRFARARGFAAVCATWSAAIADVLTARRRARVNLPNAQRKGDTMGSDIRYALRALRRQRGATVLVLMMLALGIAASVAVFALVNGLFIRPFPFPNPDRLVYINTAAPKWNLDVVGVNYPDFDQWRKGQRLFDAIATYESSTFNLAEGGNPERIAGALITYEFPRVLGVNPILGRTFTPEEDRPHGAPVVLVSSALWKSRFGSDPNIVGRTLRVDGTTRTIVGVLPSEAAFPEDALLWIPRAGDPNQKYESYSGDAMARLKPGVTIEAADADLKRAHQPVWDARDKQHIVTPFVRSLRETFVHDYRTGVSTVGGAVAVLLLIACANVAAIMLARALARRREMGIRLALGSSRLRLIRQLLLENLMLAAAGGVLGVLLGRWMLGLLLWRLPDQFPRWAVFTVDLRVIAFSVALVGLTTILFGWAPALHAVGADLRSAINETTRGTTDSPRARRTLSVLVGAEFALAAVLLVCGVLLVKAFDRVRQVDPGFRADHVLTAVVPLSEGTRPKPEQWTAFWNDLETRVAAVPGVDAEGLITCLPLAGCHTGNFFQVDGALPSPDGKDPVVLWREASPGYAAAMGLRLREGRFLEARDARQNAQPVVVVNEMFVRTFWGEGASAVGRRIKYNGDKNPWITVVGVTADVKHYGLDHPVRPAVYLPTSDNPQPTLMLAVHSSQDPALVAASLRDVVRQIDPEIPLYRVRTMDEWIQRSVAGRAVLAWMLAVFAGLALVLAIGGAYGVSTYLVTQRTREIGIRVALGARTRDVFRGVVTSGILAVGAGVVAGLVMSVALGRLMAEILFGVSPQDPAVLALVTVILLATAAVANGVPARRASRIDPMRSLRAE